MKSFYSYFNYVLFLSCFLIMAALGGFVLWQHTKINEWMVANQGLVQVSHARKQEFLNNTKKSDKGAIYPVVENRNSLLETDLDQPLVKTFSKQFDDGLFLKVNSGLIILIFLVLILSYFIIYRIYIFPLPYLIARSRALDLQNFTQAIPVVSPVFLSTIARKLYTRHSQEDFAQKTPAKSNQLESHILDQNKAQALGNVAHEIRNPLNFIVNFTDISLEYVKEMKPEQEKSNLLKTLEQNLLKTREHTKRIEAIVEGILAQARGYSSLVEKVNVNILLEEALELTRSSFNKKYNLVFEKIYDDSVPYFDASKEELLSVFINIITNAYSSMEEKYEKVGKDFVPCLKIETKRIENTITIAIEDNGCGIEEFHLNKIFQPFFTTKSSNKGTGLGLAISQEIIRRHRGKLTVDSNVNEFTRFTVILSV